MPASRLPSPALIGSRRRTVVGVWHNRVVVLLHLYPERIVFGKQHMRSSYDAERSTWTKEPGRFGVTQLRRDPVERVEDDDRVEARAFRFPGLEVADLDLGRRNVAPGDRGEVGRELDPGDHVAAPHQLRGRLAGAGPDLEHPRARLEPCELREVVEDRDGIGRSRAIVLLGHRAERVPQPLPVMVFAHG